MNRLPFLLDCPLVSIILAGRVVFVLLLPPLQHLAGASCPDLQAGDNEAADCHTRTCSSAPGWFLADACPALSAGQRAPQP